VPVAAAILAAGRGSRLASRTPKPIVRVGGRPLLTWAVDAALESGLAPVVVVVGRQGRRVAGVLPPGVHVARARDWRRGIAHSLHAAIEAIEPDPSIDAVCIGLADQPLVGAGAYVRLAEAHRAGAVLAVATYDGQRANPVLLDRSVWHEVRTLRGDTGAKTLMATHPVTEVDCSDTGAPTDVDTLDDLRRMERDAEWERDRDADH